MSDEQQRATKSQEEQRVRAPRQTGWSGLQALTKA